MDNYLARRRTPSARNAFSLVELMVTIGIILIITSIVMVRYASFNSTTLLNNQAYEIALNLREAQVFAVSVRGEENQFRLSYGLHFDASSLQYYLFGDSNNNGRYNSGEEIGDPYAIDERFTLSRLCVNSPDNCNSTVPRASVLFTRPNFDAAINGPGVSNANSLSVEVESRNGATRRVTVWQTGQIEVD